MLPESSLKSSNGFFITDLRQMDRIVEMGGGAEELMAYLVLSRGAGRSRTVSTHGANSIAMRTGMTFYRAEQSLNWLEKKGFIQKAAASDEKSKKRQPKWNLLEAEEQQELALANALLDGVGRGKHNPPLERIYNESLLGKHCVLADARLDAFMLLLRLYHHHQLADFGGVNPRLGLYREWGATENSHGNKIEDIAGTNLALFEIKGSNTKFVHQFCNEAHFYIEDVGERVARFEDAFHNLTRMKLVYEVIQIWSSNPVKNEKAHPLYTVMCVTITHARRILT